MSSQRGNVARSRPQKHQNKTAFKNNLHDTSQKTKQLNNTVITNVCMKCKEILEWKIKFKKYKILKAPKTCIRCQQKTVKHSYHTICSTCAGKLNVCPKCGKDDPNSADGSTDYSNQLQDFASVQKLLKSLPERKRRTILRCIKKNDPEKQGKMQNCRFTTGPTQSRYTSTDFKLMSRSI
ncbi:Uncharacterized protein C0J52_01278 [Blattella germanica]|nr:Uncharacterized protein C0J52_01278 [Blattella germanica]